MSKKFDGPSFLNSEHTSFGMKNKLGYQTPNLGNLKTDIEDIASNNNLNSKAEKKKTRGGKIFENIQLIIHIFI